MIRKMTTSDLPALQQAIDRDTFHPGEWKVEHFTQPTASVEVIEDSQGPIAFVRFTKSLRISCVWNDETDSHRNGRAILRGIIDAANKARENGFTEIIITTESDKLATFFEKVLKMKKSKCEYILQV
jgi:ribonuclease HI